MNAVFNFTPRFCPNCGKPLFKPESAAYLTSLEKDFQRFHAGETFTCQKCGLKFERREHITQEKTQ